MERELTGAVSLGLLQQDPIERGPPDGTAALPSGGLLLALC